jgi:hypothetical protein
VNFVLEIVGFFLFIGGFCYLVLSGRLINMFRDRAPKPLVLIAIVTAIAFHHWVGILFEPEARAETVSTPVQFEVPDPPAPAPLVVKHRARPVSEAAPVAAVDPTREPEPEPLKAIVVEEAPVQSFVPKMLERAPARVPERSGPDPYESKAKRGIKAVGRFLRFRKTD